MHLNIAFIPWAQIIYSKKWEKTALPSSIFLKRLLSHTVTLPEICSCITLASKKPSGHSF